MRLWQKVFLATLALFFGIACSMSIVYLKRSSDLMWKREGEHAVTETAYIAGNVSFALTNARLKEGKLVYEENELIENIVEICEDQVTDAYFLGFTLTDKTGNIIAATRDMQEIAYTFPASETAQYVLEQQGDRFYIVTSVPITMEMYRYVIKALFDVTDVAQEMENQKVETILISFITGIIITIFLVCIIRSMLKRLSILDRQAREIAAGSYDKRIEEKGNDELRDLSHDMNELAGAVQEKVQKLEKVAEEREMFIGDFAHEMKTPLTSILGYSQMLELLPSLSLEQQKQYAGIIREEASRMKALSSKILELTVLHAETIEKKRTDIRKLFEEVNISVQPVFQEDGKSIAMHSEDVFINADETLLGSLLYNLIDNARKACDAGGEVVVLAKADHDNVIITVSDNGCGMCEEELKKIFEPFYRVDKARSRKAGGAGLGLSLCKKIVELHEGTMHIESEKGKGTIVTLTFTRVEYR